MTIPFPARFISLPEGSIDLGWGHPAPRLHPLATMQHAFAQQAGVGYRPGPAFSATGAFPQALRLSFALYEVDALVQGAERLGHAIAAYRCSHGGRV